MRHADPYARSVLEDDVSAAIRRDEQRQRATADRPDHRGRPHADADLVEVGCWVVQGRPPRTDDERLVVDEQIMDGTTRSGVVYAVASDADPETGEITRAFMVARQWKGTVVFDRVCSDQLAKVDLPNASTTRSTARAIARMLGDRKRRGPFTSKDLQALDALDALVRSMS